MSIAHVVQHRALATVVAGVACPGLVLASCGAPDASVPQVPPGSLPAASPSLPRPTTVLGSPEEALARAASPRGARRSPPRLPPPLHHTQRHQGAAERPGPEEEERAGFEREGGRRHRSPDELAHRLHREDGVDRGQPVAEPLGRG